MTHLFRRLARDGRATRGPSSGRRAAAARFARSFAIALTSFGLAACASEPDQPMRIVAAPEGGACGLHRNGEPLGLVSRIPGDAMIPPGAAPVRVVCHREGHRPVTRLVRPAVGADTPGNRRTISDETGAIGAPPLPGGRYPDELPIRHEPIDPALLAALSREEAERFDERVALYAAQLRALRAECAAAPYAGCSLAINALERERDRELASLDPSYALTASRR